MSCNWTSRRTAGVSACPPYHNGVDVEPVLVDQVVAGELRGQVSAAEDEISTGLCLEGEHLGRHDAWTTVAFQSARSRVR